MVVKNYNKLIRDLIPEKMMNNGYTIRIRVLDNEEYKNALIEKLMEEVKEYAESGTLEELGDVYSVLQALAWTHNRRETPERAFDLLRSKSILKDENNGKFLKRIFLISSESEEADKTDQEGV